jgi:hypothetical protein
LLHSPCCITALVQGECALAQGELAYVHGELFVLFELWIGGLCSLIEHGFCLRCIEPLPFPKGSETCSSSSDLALCLSSGFRSLVGVSFSHSFFFFFSLVTKSCLLSMHSSRGRLGTMCGSRTGGWSLPGVMSD